MAHPSSSEEHGHETLLDEYLRLGGNCIHLHGEGGEVHSRRATGHWLHGRRLRTDFFLCTQICHTGWDDRGQRPIDRFDPNAIEEDIDTDLDLVSTDYLDLVYLDDNPEAPLEPVIEALARERARGRVHAFGFRNWTAKRINEAHSYISRRALPRSAAVITTELALASSTAPLWPEYLPFDEELAWTVKTLDLAVFAHASDINLGQNLYGDEDPTTRFRRHWLQRWDHPTNQALVSRVNRFASAHGITPREVNVAWLLNQNFPAVAVVPLPALSDKRRRQYDRASHLALEPGDLHFLTGG